eukprot:scaffold9792_cov121-Isochrysis_galbana.AAC.1
MTAHDCSNPPCMRSDVPIRGRAAHAESLRRARVPLLLERARASSRQLEVKVALLQRERRVATGRSLSDGGEDVGQPIVRGTGVQGHVGFVRAGRVDLHGDGADHRVAGCSGG